MMKRMVSSVLERGWRPGFLAVLMLGSCGVPDYYSELREPTSEWPRSTAPRSKPAEEKPEAPKPETPAPEVTAAPPAPPVVAEASAPEAAEKPRRTVRWWWQKAPDAAAEPEVAEAKPEAPKPQPAPPAPESPVAANVDRDPTNIDLTGDFPTAEKAPLEGFVWSPYNGKMINVKDAPSGSLIADPRFPISERKFFRVP